MIIQTTHLLLKLVELVVAGAGDAAGAINNVGLGAGSVRITALHSPLAGAAFPAARKFSHG